MGDMGLEYGNEKRVCTPFDVVLAFLVSVLIVLKFVGEYGMEVVTMFLEKEDYSVLNTLPENPIALALQASNGTSLIKDEWYEKTFGVVTQKG